MFVLSTIKDTVAVAPSTFSFPAEQIITRELNKKYANRVIQDVGLGICVFDLLEAGEGKVRYGDGCLWHKVTFRLVVFRPFPSEVLLAKVKSSTEDGIRVSIDFFDDIYIPVTYLPIPSAFDPIERTHFWLPDSEETSTLAMLDSPKANRLYIDVGEMMRIRVESDEFHDDEPGPPKGDGRGGQLAREGGRRSPYTITASIAEQGLGLLAWWTGGGDEEEYAMEE